MKKSLLIGIMGGMLLTGCTTGQKGFTIFVRSKDARRGSFFKSSPDVAAMSSNCFNPN